MNNLREFWCGFVLAVGICLLAWAWIVADGAANRITEATTSGVLVWRGEAYSVERMGDRS